MLDGMVNEMKLRFFIRQKFISNYVMDEHIGDDNDNGTMTITMTQ